MEQAISVHDAAGTLVVTEKRSVVKKFKDWYQKYGVAEKSDKLIVFVHDVRTGMVKTIETVAPAVLEVFGGEDGKVYAEIVPALARVCDTVERMAVKGILKGKEAFENVLGIERKEDAPTIDIDTSDLGEDFKTGFGGLIDVTKPKEDDNKKEEKDKSEKPEEKEVSENKGMKR